MAENPKQPEVKIEGNTLRINFDQLLRPGNLQPRLVQRISNSDRRYHYRINAEFDLVDVEVAKLYFENVVKELQEKCSPYKKIWEINRIKFPNIFINIFSQTNELLIILSLNYRNYNLYPPQVGFLTPDLLLIKILNSDLIIPDSQGVKHLITHDRGLWACIPGTYEYHDFYYDLDRWELVRNSEDDNIIVLIQRIINMIDRSKKLK